MKERYLNRRQMLYAFSNRCLGVLTISEGGRGGEVGPPDVLRAEVGVW